jgi:twitching motility two-component system response regulator PilH
MKKILVIDDSNSDAANLVSIAIKSGHDVRHCNDGIKAEDAIKDYEPDLVFMDIVMPGRDGYATVRYLRGAGFNVDSLPIYMLSSKDQPSDKEWSIRQGANGHLVKPPIAAEVMEVFEAEFSYE